MNHIDIVIHTTKQVESIFIQMFILPQTQVILVIIKCHLNAREDIFIF